VRIFGDRWRADHVRRAVDRFEAALPAGGWPNHVFGNHDVDRVISRINEDGRGQERARVAAMLLLTLRGTPFVYYGEEIGMVNNLDIPESQLQDPARVYGRGRDPERTPMQWTRGGGFTNSQPWLPYGDLSINVADQDDARDSLLSLYRRLIWLRRRSDALRYGDYAAVDDVPEGVYAFTRAHNAERTLTLLNFTNAAISFDLPASLGVAETLVGTHDEPSIAGHVTLRANEGLLLRLA
jgi:alpha-glucosidase